MENVFILTDLEGVAHVSRFEQTRVEGPLKKEAMVLLTNEVNAVIAGINEYDPRIKIHLWDGHGLGGIVKKQLKPVQSFIPNKRIHMTEYFKKYNIQALIFVGQHAMSYTLNANLCHTMSSKKIEYYMLNGELIGEFGLRAFIAGEIGVPTIFISGDDKAYEEAKNLIPNIVTVEVKKGLGWEAAVSLPLEQVHEMLQEKIQDALKLAESKMIKPVIPKKPITLEITGKHWQYMITFWNRGGEGKGMKTAIFHANSITELEDRNIL
ncbi:MAG: M55 family metallopeptidase [Promethearchaeota archaeon]